MASILLCCIDEEMLAHGVEPTKQTALWLSFSHNGDPKLMLENLTNPVAVEKALRRIRKLIDERAEWFYARASGAHSDALRAEEIDLRVEHGRLIFYCWSETGAREVWRITAWEWTQAALVMEASRKMGRESARLRLIPRAKAEEAIAIVSHARRTRAELMARAACNLLEGAKVERAGLSAGTRSNQPGRYARIILKSSRERVAVAGIVAEGRSCDIDAFLSSALIWLARLSERTRAPHIVRLWLIVEKKCVEQMAERLALLRGDFRRVLALYVTDEKLSRLELVRYPKLEELWKKRTPRLSLPLRGGATSESAALISALAPCAIDVVTRRHGETLRFHGLAFARVRRLMNREQVWFGTDAARRQLLNESSYEEWDKLLSQLKEHRRASAADHGHALYRAAPEAWLESILRRDITRLDPGLRLAPLYAQFRASSVRDTRAARPVDLLALRRDGRLVVIELKVSEDREHVLQGADYWRQVEAHRCSGNIGRAHLFGDADISDEPTLLYLVAPTLRFHRAFKIIARTINPEIETYRFDINEDWRTGVRVMRRKLIEA